MSVHQLRDGRWIVTWWDSAEKKRRRRYFGRGLEAEKAADEFNATLGLNPYLKSIRRSKSPYFRELVEAYLTAKAGSIEASTKKMFGLKMDSVILPELGRFEALRITHNRLDLYVQKRLKTVKRTTVHRELSDINAVLNWAVSRGYIVKNPIAGYKKPARDDAVIQPPTASEISKILAEASAHVIRAICISYFTGLRPGRVELLSLTWDCVDWNAGTLHVVSARKGGLRHRTVPLHLEFIKLLYRWHRQDRKLAVKKKTDFPENIVHFRGKAVKCIRKAFAAAKVKAGIKRRIRPYDLRHAFASAVLRSGADLKSTSELLGHSRPDTTVRIYQHTDLAMHKSVIDKIRPLDIPEK